MADCALPCCCDDGAQPKKGQCHPNCLRKDGWYTCPGCKASMSLCLFNDGGPAPDGGWTGTDHWTLTKLKAMRASEPDSIKPAAQKKLKGRPGWLCGECYPAGFYDDLD